MRLPYYPRWLNKLWANFWGYFWKPCPLCGRYTGGHEWNSIDQYVPINSWQGRGVCARQECIEKAKEIRQQGFYWPDIELFFEKGE
jgi:hypothetical protein